MKIGIDARFYGLQNTGLGRYVMNLLSELEKLDSKNRYFVFFRKDNFNQYQPKNNNFTKVQFLYHPYSFSSQLWDWKKMSELKLDLVHFTHFSHPIFYPGKFVVTIHDLIMNQYYQKESSTKSTVTQQMKLFGYQRVLRQALKRATRIITPTEYVKTEIINKYRIADHKITPVYEGVDNVFNNQILGESDEEIKTLLSYGINKPYLTYVGNPYPYKNVEKLLEVMKTLSIEKDNEILNNLNLVIISPASFFTERLRIKIKKQNLQKRVKLINSIPDEKLVFLYKNALAFITASFAEGFGLPGLEAMASGCPVLASDRSCLPEVYGEAALYFDPENTKEITEKIRTINTESKLRSDLIFKGIKQSRKYSWKKMAQEIACIYTNAIGENKR